MKSRLLSVTPEKTLLAEVAVTGLRVFTGLSMALGHGFGKLPPSEQFISGVHAMGFPAPSFFAWAASLSESVGGLCLAAGLATRLSGLSIAATMTVAAVVRHAADPFKVKELAFLYLLIALVFVVKGGGTLSLDRLLTTPSRDA